MRVGLIGLGAIGLSVCRLNREHVPQTMTLVGALVRDRERPRPAVAPPVVDSLDVLLDAEPEVIVEAGGHAALRAYGARILRRGCDVLTVSVGALADPAVEADLRAAAQEGSAVLRVASGAIGGLDAIGAARLGGLVRVTHTTTKPARALLPAAEADRLEAPLEVYRGVAREAALRYPESVNVMAAVSLAGLGMDRTEVRVVADPRATHNQHVVTAEGAFGTLRIDMQNVPSSDNPRTGVLTGLSMFRALLDRHANVRIG